MQDESAARSPQDASPPDASSPPADTTSPVDQSDPKWGSWGQLPEGTEKDLPPIESREMPLLDHLKAEDEERTETGVVGPDGYEYPPLTKAGADALRRMWAGELPEGRKKTVAQWDDRVRCAVQINTAIPAAPRIPPKEVLNRPFATVRSTKVDMDMSRWTVQEDPVESSEEIKEFNDKGELVPETVTKLCQKREEARKNRDFQTADFIRNQLEYMGVQWNDQLQKWRTEDGKTGSWGDGITSPTPMMAHQQMNQGGAYAQSPSPSDSSSTAPPIELQDIDMPGSWDDFLRLPDPKVLAVGPRGGDRGRRAWGAGGQNWGTTSEEDAVKQAFENCRNQGVNNPKVIYPPHLYGQKGGGGKGWGGKGRKGGFSPPPDQYQDGYSSRDGYRGDSNYSSPNYSPNYSPNQGYPGKGAPHGSPQYARGDNYGR